MSDKDRSPDALVTRPDPLAALSPLYLVALFLPLALTSAIGWLLSSLFQEAQIREPGWVAYVIANILVLTGLYGLLRTRGAFRAIFLFKPPNWRDFGLAVAAFLIGVFVVFPVASEINDMMGTPMRGLDYTLDNRSMVALVIVFAVATAPFAEEVLFRGLGIGLLMARGFGPLLSGAIVVIAFALIHLPYFGIGGAIFILLWGVLPTVLRLYTGNLTAAWIMHVLNNAFAYVGVKFLGWA